MVSVQFWGVLVLFKNRLVLIISSVISMLIEVHYCDLTWKSLSAVT